MWLDLINIGYRMLKTYSNKLQVEFKHLRTSKTEYVNQTQSLYTDKHSSLNLWWIHEASDVLYVIYRLIHISLHFNGHFPGESGLAGDGDNWSYKSCKVPVKSSSPTNQHPTFYRPDALPVAQPTVSKHWSFISSMWFQVFWFKIIPLLMTSYFRSCRVNSFGLKSPQKGFNPSLTSLHASHWWKM